MSSQVYRLVMRAGPLSGKTFDLTKEEITIGRDTANELVISDAEVSRHHCRLMRQGNQYLIEDLGSTNGTFLNGQRLTGIQALLAGQTVQLGEAVSFVYEIPGQDADDTMAKPPRQREITPQPAPVAQAKPAAPPQRPAPQPAPARPQPSPMRPPQAQERAQYASREMMEPEAPAAAAGGTFLERAMTTVRARPILFGCLALVIVGGCFGLLLLWYIDRNVLWCDVLGQTMCEWLGRLYFPN